MVKDIFKNLALVASATIIAVAIAEIILRTVGISYPGFHTMDEKTGLTLLPGAEGWYNREGHAYVKINSDGLRDREHPGIKPAGTYRIAVLGDSYAEALQVPIENTYWSVIEDKLASCAPLSNKSVEVINFGVSGYGTAQELITLRHRVWKYSPDLIVLSVLTGNDIRNNVRQLEKDPMRPYFLLTKEGLVLDDSFLESSGYRMRVSKIGQIRHTVLENSYLAQLLNEAKNRLWTQFKIGRRMRASAQVVDEFHGNEGYGEIGLEDMIYKTPKDPVWRKAWAVTEELILQMKRDIDGRAEYLVAVLSNAIQVHPDERTRAEYMKRLRIADIFYPDKRIERLGRKNEITVISLAERMQSFAVKNSVFLHGFENTTLGEGHWNRDGHALAGRYIATDVCQFLLENDEKGA